MKFNSNVLLVVAAISVGNPSFAHGWENDNTANGEWFDVNCEYRFLMNEGAPGGHAMYYFDRVRPIDLRATINNRVEIQVLNNNKAEIRIFEQGSPPGLQSSGVLQKRC